MLKNLILPAQLIIFPDFWAKILRIAHSVNYSYLPPRLGVTYISKIGVFSEFDEGRLYTYNMYNTNKENNEKKPTKQ